jgi:hypothetical protein
MVCSDSCAEATAIQWLAGLFGDDVGIDVSIFLGLNFQQSKI